MYGLTVLVVWIKNVPHSSCIWTCGSQLEVLFGEVLEPFGYGVLLEVSTSREWVLMVYSLTLLPVLFPVCGWKDGQPATASMLHWLLPSFPIIVDAILWNPMLKQTLSSLSGFCDGVYHGSRKVPDTWPPESQQKTPWHMAIQVSTLLSWSLLILSQPLFLQVFPLLCSSQRQRSEHLPFLEINTTATNKPSDLANSAPDISASSFHLAFLTNSSLPSSYNYQLLSLHHNLLT